MLKLLIFLFILSIHPLCICACFLSLKFKKHQILFHLYKRQRGSYSNNPSQQTSTAPGSLWVSFPSSSLGLEGVHASSSPAAQHTWGRGHTTAGRKLHPLRSPAVFVSWSAAEQPLGCHCVLLSFLPSNSTLK